MPKNNLKHLLFDNAALGGGSLFLRKDGKEYDQEAQDVPLLPAFQVQPNPQLNRPGDHPPFTAKADDALLGS